MKKLTLLIFKYMFGILFNLFPLSSNKNRIAHFVSHVNPVPPYFTSATRLSLELGIRGFPRLLIHWSSGPPTYFGGQASSDYSGFGFVGLYSLF